MQARPDDPRIGTILGGRYTLRRLIGSGAVGVVYEAVNEAGRPVAIKLLLERTDVGLETRVAEGAQKEDARFAREALITSPLSHPNIASVIDSGFGEGAPLADGRGRRRLPYIVMDLLSGEDLASILERTGALPPTIAVRILLGACAGVAAANGIGIVHRDIKPSNIFLHDVGSRERIVKVCDFGLAKQIFASETVTESGNVIGSPAYMSPEQARNAKRVDARTDVWSLAMTLYEMLTGHTAFYAEQTIYTLVIALATEDVPPIQRSAPWISPDLATVIHGALLREPSHRCPDVSALLDALRPFAGGSLRIDASDLAAISDDERARRAPRALLPHAWLDLGSRPTSLAPRAQTEDPVARLLGHTLAGRHPLRRVLGEGPSGAVYETEGAPGERRAIKVGLREGGWDKASLRRYVSGARSLIAIESEHVVRVFEADFDLVEQLPFFVMEIVDGPELASVLRTEGPIETRRVARLFREAARGLGAAHARGVTHRRLTTARLFLCRSAHSITMKVGGFAVDSAEPGEERSDVFDLALALYQASSNQRPWTDTRPDELPALHEIAPWVSRAFAQVVHDGLRRDPTERYASMEHFAEALEPFAAREDEGGW